MSLISGRHKLHGFHKRLKTLLLAQYQFRVSEHLEEPSAAIEKMYNLLARDGRLLITTPHVPDWDWEEDHLWRWTHQEFRDMILDISTTSLIWSDDIFMYAVMAKD